jgi:hypothetical protein
MYYFFSLIVLLLVLAIVSWLSQCINIGDISFKKNGISINVFLKPLNF